MDEGTHAHMTEIIMKQKQLKQDMIPVEDKLKEWLPRLEDVTKLYEEIKKKYLLVKEAVDKLNAAKSKLVAEYDALEMEKEMIRRNAVLDAAKPSIDSDALLAQFKDRGIDPQEALVQKEAQKVDAEAALAELKAKMGIEEKPPK